MGQFISKIKAAFDGVREKLPRRVWEQQSLIDKRNSRVSGIDLSLIQDEFKDVSKDKFRFKETKFNGHYKATSEGKKEKLEGKPIEYGIRKFKKYPNLYYAMFYPDEALTWPENEQQYVYLHRAGLEGLKPSGVSPKANVTILTHEFQPLKPFKGDILPKRFCDKYTDTVLSQYKGTKIHSKKNLPLLPGRGMGYCDEPHLKLIADIDPSSIEQGKIGDCWLLSGISSLAEYDGAIERLFRKTKNLSELPKDSANKYTVTLYDLTTWTEVDVVVDERLCSRLDGSRRPLGAKTTVDAQLWVPYLEKAIAAHCGGWDKIDGGNCTHAWALLTGVKEQYIIQKQEATGKFICNARYDPDKKEWLEHGNSPHDGPQGMFQIPWPSIGKKKGGKKPLSEKALFQRICQWDEANYLIGAASKGSSDKNSTDGIVDNHAYSVVDCRSNVAGTGIDMIQVRNPWGYGGNEKAKFRHKGPGWKKYPEIKKELRPIFNKSDGLFWLTRQEFFKYYDSVFVGACDMKKFLGK